MQSWSYDSLSYHFSTFWWILRTLYLSLVIGISILYDKIFRKRINSLMDSNGKINSKEPLNNLKEEIENVHSEQKLKKLNSIYWRRKSQLDNGWWKFRKWKITEPAYHTEHNPTESDTCFTNIEWQKWVKFVSHTLELDTNI